MHYNQKHCVLGCYMHDCEREMCMKNTGEHSVGISV